MPNDTPAKIPEITYPMTDAGNGQAIAEEWGVMVRYVYEWKTWIVYLKGYWAVDSKGYMKRFAVKTMRRLYEEAIIIDDLEQRKKVAKWYIDSESEHRISSMLDLATSEPGISITADKLDSKLWLLNVKNGTIDLQTCTLRDADPDDLITQQINLDYDPNEVSQEWLEFLNTIFNNDIHIIDYIQRGIGYTLNGSQLERVFFFLYGLGKNGKSALMDALRRVFGPYALEAKPELFMEKRYTNNGPDEGQAALKGIRLLTATEVKRNQTLDVSLIKRMTGSEPIWHEKKFQRGFSFVPTHTLWLSGNHEPKIKDTTDSIWDRLNKIPFEIRINGDREIKGYGSKLANEHGKAILNWCIEGAKKWRDIGLINPPESVLLANEDYRSRQDLLHDFIEDKIKIEPGENTPLQDVYAAYCEYSKENDEGEPMGKRFFNDAMRERGFKDKRGHGNKPEWIGVTLVTLVTLNTHFPESFSNARAREKLSSKSVTEVTTVAKSTEISNQQKLILNVNEEKLPNCKKCGSCDWFVNYDCTKLICPCGEEINYII